MSQRESFTGCMLLDAPGQRPPEWKVFIYLERARDYFLAILVVGSSLVSGHCLLCFKKVENVLRIFVG